MPPVAAIAVLGCDSPLSEQKPLRLQVELAVPKQDSGYLASASLSLSINIEESMLWT